MVEALVPQTEAALQLYKNFTSLPILGSSELRDTIVASLPGKRIGTVWMVVHTEHRTCKARVNGESDILLVCL